MNVKRYFAPTAREALRALKEELGADAIVLSNRAVEGGVEILALPADAVGALHNAARSARPAPAAPRQPAYPPAAPTGYPQAAARRDEPVEPRAPARPAPRFDDDDFHVSLSALAAGAVPRNAAAPAVRQPGDKVIRPFNPPRIETADYMLREEKPQPRSAPAPRRAVEEPAATAPAAAAAAPMVAPEAAVRDDGRVRELQETNARLMAELSGIRGMIERQLAGFAWGETRRQAPARAAMVGELLEAGFSAPSARKLAEAVGEDDSPQAARAAVRAELDRALRARASDDDLIDRGGVFALVGPTGVGKTTTTAKLAARCVVRHGASKLALITTDGYRIGAQEQLRIYGRILGVPVFSVRDAADLRQTLAELRNKHMVLIDTMGVSQRDRMVAEQAAMLTGAGEVRRLLLLNATCRGDTLDDVVRAYAGPDLAGVIFSKVDEAASLAPAIDVAVRRKLDLLYVTNGQRVPEDLHLPNRAYLLHRALREQSAESPWRMNGDEAGLMLAAGSGA
ncbi:flagellar biosynthesis protein FlhF [Azoarcus olearius]|uniref:Flagellar biosynthesis protein FlhF n=1 Tax=Azoarcus sp. (strain BH72) TaxID=418699 RepID=A1K4G7_AZOSB|nr:flagellar biosynthesis protein FlhF [Azoarcus olearius]ANQ84270.1 flagellar biosynthesis regulator FlhF [Azoarcus olearius]CAL93722.1 putative flagellar biosynthesis protein FlhF [Azoarcus olearius]